MIHTKSLLMAKLVWPPKPPDKDDARRQSTVMAAARRCLHDSAPAELLDTGFQLLDRSKEEELKQCLQNILTDIGMGLSQTLILIDAPPVTEHTEQLYNDTVNALVENIADELENLSAHMPTVRITGRLFDKVNYAYAVATDLTDLPLLVTIGKLLDQLTVLDHAKDRDKSTRLCLKLAQMIRSKL